jgi:hypothetical protein
MIKPSIFIGSSSEGLEFARAVRFLLREDAEVTMWDEGFFRPGSTFIETLVNSRLRFDFAILVLTPDESVQSREITTLGPRDNVLFELGLFVGSLGRERTFVLRQAGVELKLPTDLAGVTTTTFKPREDGDHRAAVGAACDSMREVIRDLGLTPMRASKHLEQVQQRQDVLEANVVANENRIKETNQKMAEQQTLINKLVETSMSTTVFQHLAGIYLLHVYHYWQNHDVGELFQREFYYLKIRGFIGPQNLEFTEGLNGQNIAALATPTEIGKIYIALRKDDIPKDWLSENPEKRRNLKTDVARGLGLTVPTVSDGGIHSPAHCAARL